MEYSAYTVITAYVITIWIFVTLIRWALGVITLIIYGIIKAIKRPKMPKQPKNKYPPEYIYGRYNGPSYEKPNGEIFISPEHERMRQRLKEADRKRREKFPSPYN